MQVIRVQASIGRIIAIRRIGVLRLKLQIRQCLENVKQYSTLGGYFCRDATRQGYSFRPPGFEPATAALRQGGCGRAVVASEPERAAD